MRERNCGINIRVTEKEKLRLQKNAHRCRLSVSGHLRKAGLEKKLEAFPQKDFFEIYKAVRSILAGSSVQENPILRQKLEEIFDHLKALYLENFPEYQTALQEIEAIPLENPVSETTIAEPSETDDDAKYWDSPKAAELYRREQKEEEMFGGNEDLAHQGQHKKAGFLRRKSGKNRIF